MKILIVGAGEVGFNIAARLVDEGHDVMIVERDEGMLGRATENLDVQGIRGHGARPQVLEEAGIADADMLVAVTDLDEVNMVACLTAAILGRKDIIKIARVRDTGYMDARIFHDPRVAIDMAINPERETADKILTLLKFPAATEVVDFAGGRVQLVGLRIADTSPLAGMRFLELPERFNRRVLVAALHRDDEVIVPRGDDVILPGDEAYLVVPRGHATELLTELGVPVEPATRVMIAGGTKLGRFLARDLAQQGIVPKLVEPDPQLARWLGDQLAGVIVLQGNPTDAALLREENVGEMHTFIATGRVEEVNVMSALLAQRLGARRVIATVNRVDYAPLAKAMGIDVCISPRMTAVSSILHFIRRGRVVASRALGEEESAEAIEFEAQLTSEVVDVPLRELRLPKGALIACLLRGDEVIVPTGDAVIQAGDHVVIVASKQAIGKVERMLARRQDQA
ncbi:MAG: Trk system potassium transporter TrkA [bacterium]